MVEGIDNNLARCTASLRDDVIQGVTTNMHQTDGMVRKVEGSVKIG